MNSSTNTPTDLNAKAKELCNLNICTSMAEARRIIITLSPQRLEKIVENKIKKQNEYPKTTNRN